jgi:hypothetical protein
MFLVYNVVGCAYHGISFVNQVMTLALVKVTIPAVDQVVDLVITADPVVAQVTKGGGDSKKRSQDDSHTASAPKKSKQASGSTDELRAKDIQESCTLEMGEWSGERYCN